MKNVARQGRKLYIGVFTGIVLACSCYYNILFDILLIIILLICSYLIGLMLKIEGSLFEKMIMRTASGLGIIGIAIYFILLAGFGNKSIYMLLLILCVAISMPFAVKKRQELSETLYYVKNSIRRHWIIIGVLLLVLSGYLMYGSAPISMYDSLTKHLPVTVYAAESGKWYTNVTEAIVYGDPMVLQYTYCVLFYSLGAYKALILFNVMLFFGVYIILAYFMRRIYAKSNLWILAVILLTTPFFFQFSTMFYLEILPLYFLFSAFVGIGEIDRKKIWNNIELISFLCGCAIFVKLTLAFTMVIMAQVLIFNCVRYALEKRIFKQAAEKAIRCLLLVIMPSAASIIHIWYKTGNPVYPSYNGIFRSPYFAAENFQDPFTNKLTFSIHSLIDIVFHTSLNIEMGAYGLGIFLLFLFTVPLAIGLVIIKKKAGEYQEYIVWSLVIVVAYIANTLTSYNLRYYFAVWILFACVITIGISICISLVSQKTVRFFLLLVVGGIIIYPNLTYLKEYGAIPYKLIKDEQIVKNDFCDALNVIPQGKRVLSVTNSNQLKGQYKGYFASTTWHNVTLSAISNGRYTWEEYLSSFDYIAIDTTMKEPWGVTADILTILPDFLGEKVYENSACSVYEVVPQLNELVEVEFDTPQQTSVVEPLTDILQNTQTEYYITHQVFNETGTPVTMRFQINWMSESGEFIDCYISLYDAEPGNHEYCSEKILTNPEASYGIIYIVTADEQKVKINGYSVKGINNVAEREELNYENRSLLRHGNLSMLEEAY